MSIALVFVMLAPAPAICLTLSSLPLKQLVIFMSWWREGGIVSSFRWK